MKTGLLIPILALCSSVLTPAQEAAFKLSTGKFAPPVGVPFIVETVMPSEKGTMSMTFAGQELEGNLEMSVKETWRFKALPDGKLDIEMLENSGETKTTLDGEETVELETNHLKGAKLIAERRDGQWEVQLQESKPTPEQEELIDGIAVSLRAHDLESKGFGAKDYALGQRIKRDEPLFGGFGLIEDDLTGEVDLKILRLEELDGLRCAVLSGRFSESGTVDFEEEAQEETMTISGQIMIWRSIEHGLDIRSAISGGITFQLSMLEGQMKMSAKVPAEVVTTIAPRKQ